LLFFGQSQRERHRESSFRWVLPFESSDRQPISLCAHRGVDMRRSSTTITVTHPELFNAPTVIPVSELDGLGFEEAHR
jgi:hypothetical protein